MKEPLTYARYNTREDAEYLTSLLHQNNIPFEMAHEVNQLDNIYLGDALDQLFILKIPGEKFTAVNKLLAEQARHDFQATGFTHYFDSFNENELLEVLENPNDWNAYDAEIARLKLEKDESANPVIAASVDYTKAYQPEHIKTEWLIVAYLFSFILLGIMVGSLIVRTRKTLQNGASVYMYDEAARKHGQIMIIIGAIGTSLFFSRFLLS